jgi:hypothetical protein
MDHQSILKKGRMVHRPEEARHDKDIVFADPGNFLRLGPAPGGDLQLAQEESREKRLHDEKNFIRLKEEITMLEFWCVVIFLALSASSIWLIYALDKMMGGET